MQSTAGGRDVARRHIKLHVVGSEALIQGLKKVMADSPLTSPSALKTPTTPTERAIAGVA